MVKIGLFLTVIQKIKMWAFLGHSVYYSDSHGSWAALFCTLYSLLIATGVASMRQVERIASSWFCTCWNCKLSSSSLDAFQQYCSRVV